MTRHVPEKVEIPIYRKRGTRDTLTFDESQGEEEAAVISAPGSVMLDTQSDVVTLIAEPEAEASDEPPRHSDKTNTLDVHPEVFLRYASKGWYGLSVVRSADVEEQ